MHSGLSTHRSLLERLGRGGDQDAWREFHDRYHDLIRGFARRNGLQPVDADDLAQEVLMALHAALPSFDYDPARGRFRGFLKTIALRAIWRRRSSAKLVDDAALEHLAEDVAIDADFEQEWRSYHLRQAMARIRVEFPRDHVALFEQLAIEGRTTAEVERESSVPADRLYRIKSQILARCRALIAAQVAEEG
ncbi:MAG: RNA polymerase sigma factor [Planctomycetota bacterium]